MLTKLPHILFITYDGLSDPLGQSQVLPYIEGLSDAGFRFTLMTCEKPDRYAALGSKLKERCSAKKINWMPIRYSKRPPILSTLYDMRIMRKNAEKLHSSDPIAMIHCRSYLPCLIAVKLKRLFGIPYLFDMRGFYADERVDGKIWDLNNPVYKAIYSYFKHREKEFLMKADGVVSLTHAGKDEIISWYHEKPMYGGGVNMYNHDMASQMERKMVVIPCTADLEHFDYRQVSENKMKWLSAVHGMNPDHEYLGYVGSLGTWYMLDEMLEFYKILIERHPKVRLLVLSKDHPDTLFRKAAERNIPISHLVHVSAERKEVPVFMHMMKASVFFILPSYSKKASSPTKQGELMAMGVPIICNKDVGDADAMIKETKTGMVLASFDKSSMMALTGHWEELITIDKVKIRNAAQDMFSLKWGLNEYVKIYRQILS